MLENDPCEPHAADVIGRSWVPKLGLAALPIVAALAVYYLAAGPETATWQLQGDQVFYEYQMGRVAEVGGMWWKIPDDLRLGWPYQSEVAKYPHLLEGLDLLLISTITARLLNPVLNYHLLVLAVIAINGWIAAWLTHRLTRSYGWAAASVLLITLNGQVMGRMRCHLHLFKFGWFLLATWAFWRFLEAPTWRRGAALGLAVAMVLQGSIYFGYFAAITFGLWWVGCLIAGRFDRRIVAGTAAALGVFVPFAALVVGPVWAVTKNRLLADGYARRPLKDAWVHSAELWQYFLPDNSPWVHQQIKEIGVKPAALYGEGWNYLGLAVLTGISIYAIARLRGKRLCEAQGFLDLVMGQIALLVGLSLSGGPSFFLHWYVPAIRAYGRSGELALGLGCVAAPVIFHGLSCSLGSRWLRAAVAVAALGLVVYDGYQIHTGSSWGPRGEDKTPAWVAWLAKQPPRAKLAAFSPVDNDHWFRMAAYRVRHHHTTLNGCDWELLNGDLRLLGGSYLAMNGDGLKYVASLGYDNLAFHRDFLKTHPWIGALPWLKLKANLGDWQIYRAGAGTPRFPTDSLKRILANQARQPAPSEVPPKAWITGRLDLDQTVVVLRPRPISLAWAKPDGTLVSEPGAGLFQHVYGPDIPAYTVETPNEAGSYQLVFLDEQGHRLASKPYVVSAKLQTLAQAFGAAPPNLSLNTLLVGGNECGTGQVRIALENKSPHYIQAHSTRNKELGSARTQPGIATPGQGSAFLMARIQRGAASTDQSAVILPQDIPPGGRLEMNVQVQRENLVDASSSVVIIPGFHFVDPKLATAVRRDQALSLSLSPDPRRLATGPATSAAQ